LFRKLIKTLKKYLPLRVQKFLWRVYCFITFTPCTKVERILFSGNYKKWEDAEALCQGYSAPNILEKVLTSTFKVKRGEAAFERDSVLFDIPQYPWPLLSSLLLAASRSYGKINIVDFGGSLGSTFFQCREFIAHFQELTWKVVEQPHFVDAGCRLISEGPLHFTESTDQAFKEGCINLLLLGSVLQFLPSPHLFLEQELTQKWNYILIDRTPFLVGKNADRLTIQSVPASIYEAKYPAWFFDEERFLQHFSKDFKLIAEWKSPDRIPLADAQTIFKGFFFERRKS
jgi:putative methyltransferase (TIGR04325 family)